MFLSAVIVQKFADVKPTTSNPNEKRAHLRSIDERLVYISNSLSICFNCSVGREKFPAQSALERKKADENFSDLRFLSRIKTIKQWHLNILSMLMSYINGYNKWTICNRFALRTPNPIFWIQL